MIWGGYFDPEQLNQKLSQINENLQNPEIWRDHSKLNSLNKEKSNIENKINEISIISSKFKNISELINISIELNDSSELENQIKDLEILINDIESLETKRYFSKKDDLNNKQEMIADVVGAGGAANSGAEKGSWGEWIYDPFCTHGLLDNSIWRRLEILV